MTDFVTKHMPPVFTRQFAARLDSLCASTVLEASGGEDLQPGHVYVAPGDFHLELRATVQGAQTVLHQDPLVNFSRPSFDVLSTPRQESSARICSRSC